METQFGDRIRQARHERGLTQKQLGGADFSAAYISQLERDRVRPSVRALEILSRRLGKPLAYFFEAASYTERLRRDWEYTYLRGEAELARQNRRRAVQYLKQAEELASKLEDTLLLARTKLRLSEALPAGELQEAIRLCTEALRTFEELGRDRLAAAASLQLGQRYEDNHNLLLAVQYYQSALRSAAETPGAELTAFKTMVALGAAYSALNEPAAAMVLLHRAGAMVDDLVSTGQVAETRLNQAHELHHAGDFGDALELLREAHALYSTLDLSSSVGRSLRLLAGTLVGLQGTSTRLAGSAEDNEIRPRQVRSYLEQSLELERRTGNPGGQAEALLGLAELSAPHHSAEAQETLSKALVLAEQAGLSELRAQILHKWGQLARPEDEVRAREKLEEALQVLTDRPVSALRARIHRELGELLRNQGETMEALRHFEQAALELEELRT